MTKNADKDKPLELIEIVEDKGAKTFIYRNPEKKESLSHKFDLLIDKLLRRK